MPRYEFEPRVRKYKSIKYKYEYVYWKKGSMDFINKVPFKWACTIGDDEEMMVFEKVVNQETGERVRFEIYKSVYLKGKKTEVDKNKAKRIPWKMKKKIIVGDMDFNQKSYTYITSKEIRNIYNEVLQLNLDDEKDLLDFVSRNGLPYSDGLTYANLNISGNLYEDLFPNDVPNFREMGFVDVEEIYKAAYGLWLLQTMSKVKHHLDELDDENGDVTKETTPELFVLIFQILLTYDGKVFYLPYNDMGEIHSDTGAFIKHVIQSFNFSKKDINKEKIREKLHGEVKYVKTDEGLKYIGGGRMAIPLYNKQCENLTRILISAVNKANRRGMALLENTFENDNIILYKMLLNEYGDEMVINVARKVYYDILTEIMYNANQQQDVKSNGTVHVTSYLPSLIHALFYELYYNDIGSFKVCEGCGKLFPKKMRKGSYCSTKCKNRKNKQDSRAANVVQITDKE